MSFAEKKAIYQKSNITMTREVASEADWNQDKINERKEELAKKAVDLIKIDFPEDL